jgi:hypothetical protein
VLALQGRPWTDFEPAEKIAFRRRFDALKARGAAAAQARPGAALAAELDRLGVRLQPTSSSPEKK